MMAQLHIKKNNKIMKKILSITLFTILSINCFSQDPCYSVKKVENKTKIEGLSSKKFVFGIKQMTEEIISEKKRICQDGIPVSVFISSIEAPTKGINIGPFMIKKKTTIVKISVQSGDSISVDGEGESKLSVSSTFLELSDENLPFEQTVFSSAIKKALLDALNKF
jgi:hypothetical protein